jgi:segregation and condensation protein A
MPHKVKIDIFEGPFDLLLHLVRIHEMDIYDIPLAEITRQYLDYIKQMERLDLSMAGDFLVMAATLINLKSRALMPPMTEDEAEEDEEEIDEEYENIRNAQDLMERLIEYRQFKELAQRLSNREKEQVRMFYRNSVLPSLGKDKDEDEEMREDISFLFSAFSRLLEFAEGRPTHHVIEEEFSVEEKIEEIRRKISQETRLNVMLMFRRCINKQEAITLFLALLEVCRMQIARVRQGANYEDIELVSPSEPEDDED